MKDFSLCDKEKIIWDFLNKINKELSFPAISEKNHQTLKKYYSGWGGSFPLTKQYYYIKRLSPVVDLIRKGKIKKILDIGSGCGTESIFFSSLGCRVLGVDLSEERISCAEERKTYHEKLLGRKLDLDFKTGSLFDMDNSENFDAIWLLEAIHHIEPPLQALKFSHSLLSKEGYIIISDPNSLNFLVQLKLFLKRGFTFHKKVLNPKTGEMVDYGEENIFSVWEIKKMLKAVGFRPIETSYQGFLPPNNFIEDNFKKFKVLEDLLRKIPILKNISKGYTIVARRINLN